MQGVGEDDQIHIAQKQIEIGNCFRTPPPVVGSSGDMSLLTTVDLVTIMTSSGTDNTEVVHPLVSSGIGSPLRQMELHVTASHCILLVKPTLDKSPVSVFIEES